MKKIILLYAIIGLFIFGCGEADTLNPEDNPFSGNKTVEGTVGALIAIVCGSDINNNPTAAGNPSVDNPVVVIKFVDSNGGPSPVKGSSIIAVPPVPSPTPIPSIQVEYNGSDITFIPGAYSVIKYNSDSINTLYIDLSPQNPTATTTIRITLTSDIESNINDSLTLYNAGIFTRRIIKPWS